MRKTRGYQPGKTTPIRTKAERTVTYQAANAGVARERISADEAMASHFDARKHIEKFPHGYDPHAGDVTALQKKVVFRPNKHQIDAIVNRVKPAISVNVKPGIAGYAAFTPEKPKFRSKNATPAMVAVSARPIASVEPRAERPILEKKGDLVEMQAGYVYDHLEDVEVAITRNNKHFHQDQPEMEAGFDVSSGYSQTPTVRPQIQTHKKNNAEPDDINAGFNYQQDIDNLANGFDIGYDTRSHKVRNNNETPMPAGYVMDNDGVVDVGYVRTGKDLARQQNSDYPLQASYQFQDGTRAYDFDQTSSQQHRQVQGNAMGEYIQESQYNHESNLDLEEVQEHAKPDVRQFRRHQATPKKKQAGLRVEINADKSAQTSKQRRKNQTNPNQMSAQSEFDQLYDTSGVDVRQNHRRLQSKPIQDNSQANFEDVNFTEGFDAGVRQHRRYQANPIQTQADAEFQDEGFNQVESNVQRRRLQAQPTEQEADLYLDEMQATNSDNIDTRQRRRQQSQVSDEYAESANTYSEHIPTQYRNQNPQNRRLQAQVTHQEANSEFELREFDNQLPNGQRRRLQNRPEQESANPELQASEFDHVPSNPQRRRMQPQSNKTYAEVELEGTEFNHNEVNPQRRRLQAQSNKTYAEAEFDQQINNQYEVNDQRRRLQARSNKTTAEAEFQDAGFNQPEINNQHRRLQAQSNKSQAEIEFTNEGINELDVIKHRRRHQAQVVNAQATGEFDVSSGEFDNQLQNPQRRRLQAQPSTSRAEVEFEHDGNIKSQIISQRRQHQAAPIEASAGLDLESDHREIRVPSSRPKKHHQEVGMMVTSKVSDVDVKIRVQNALAKSRNANNRHNVNQEMPANQAGLDSNMDIKVGAEKISNRRQYSAKQAEEYAHPTVDAPSLNIKQHRDVNADRNNVESNRQQAKVEAMNAQAIPDQPDVNNNLDSRLMANGKSNRRERPDQVGVSAGYQNDHPENNSLDPRTLMSTDTKHHLARPDAMDAGIAVDAKDEKSERTGQEYNTRQREPMIKPTVGAGKNHNVKKGKAPVSK